VSLDISGNHKLYIRWNKRFGYPDRTHTTSHKAAVVTSASNHEMWGPLLLTERRRRKDMAAHVPKHYSCEGPGVLIMRTTVQT
jgi:hypothetical protein